MADKRVLAVGVSKEALNTVSRELQRDSYEVEMAPTARSALSLLAEIRFDLVVVAHPQPDLHLRRFITGLRADTSASKRAKLLILATEPGHPDLHRLHERSVEIISSGDSLIGDLAKQALSGDPRVQMTVIVRLAADLPYGRSQRICQSENLSVSGMLVRSSDTLPVGTPIQVQFTLPGAESPLRLDAKVVRLTGPGEIPGIALCFESVAARQQAELERFMERQER
jgi:CheY-like chemotaxis protein